MSDLDVNKSELMKSTVVASENEEKDSEDNSTMGLIKQTFKLLIKPRFFGAFLPLIMWSAASLAIY